MIKHISSTFALPKFRIRIIHLYSNRFCKHEFHYDYNKIEALTDTLFSSRQIKHCNTMYLTTSAKVCAVAILLLFNARVQQVCVFKPCVEVDAGTAQFSHQRWSWWRKESDKKTTFFIYMTAFSKNTSLHKSWLLSHDFSLRGPNNISTQ